MESSTELPPSLSACAVRVDRSLRLHRTRVSFRKGSLVNVLVPRNELVKFYFTFPGITRCNTLEGIYRFGFLYIWNFSKKTHRGLVQ